MKKTTKYNTELCDNKMTFQDCELAILRHAVDESEKIQSQKIANSEEVRNIISIVEEFLKVKKCICYGGTAINNILPKFAQFYDRDIEIPDYDFYSKTPLDDAKELADIYYKAGYTEIEAKAGVHHGTYKVFVNFLPIADLTYLEPEIFDTMRPDAIEVSGILYAPPDFLRMNMFLELSRPSGDVSRWEKVLKRMSLLNRFYPMKIPLDCSTVDFQRKMVDYKTEGEQIYLLVRNSFVDQGVVFFGGYASSLYSQYMPEDQRRLLRKVPDFDVISEDPGNCALIVKERLEREGFKKIKIVEHNAIGELIPKHVEICIGRETLAFIFEPIACHSYNKIQINGEEVRVATIDTMLSFYFAFYYSKRPYFFKDRILCMAKFLFDVEQKNRLEQKGLLKRFSIDCYGKQPTIESIRAEKTAKFQELKGNRNSREFEEWFLRYNPGLKIVMKENPNEEKLEKTLSVKTKSKKSASSNKKSIKKKPTKTKSRTFKLPFGIELA
jgi:Poly(A) polymerase catalytic subunit